MRLHKAEKMAMAEQLNSRFPHPEPGVDQKKGKKVRMTRELFTPRSRRTENILISMCDNLRQWEPPEPETPKKKSQRKRKRGSKILVSDRTD